MVFVDHIDHDHNPLESTGHNRGVDVNLFLPSPEENVNVIYIFNVIYFSIRKPRSFSAGFQQKTYIAIATSINFGEIFTKMPW